MKGVVLAGGLATRLKPLSDVVNKHLFPVYNLPMIYYPIKTLVDGGISEILVVIGERSAGDIVNLLQDGSELGAKVSYRYQAGGALGIAHALNLAKDFVDGDFALILGDNIFMERFDLLKKQVPHLFLVESITPEKFGVAEIKDGKIVHIVEKPKKPTSYWIVTGLYLYPKHVFDLIDNLKPSARGELEITDLNNMLGSCSYTVVDKWFDVGEYEMLLEAANLVKENHNDKRS
jgi:glucose-1-phosphate thymidylyltransferase